MVRGGNGALQCLMELPGSKIGGMGDFENREYKRLEWNGDVLLLMVREL